MMFRRSIFRLSVFLISILIGVSACSKKGPYDEMDSSMGRKYDRKIKALKKILKKDYNNPKTHNYLGVLYAKRGWVEEALREYKTAIDLSPDYVEVYENLADLYMQMQEQSKAMEMYQKVLNFDSSNLRIKYKLAALYKERGRVKEAIREYLQLLEMDPNFYLAHNNVGVIFYEGEKYQKAKHHFEKAMEIAPDYPDAYLNLGILWHFNLGDKPLSLKYYRKYIDLKKDDGNVLVAEQLLSKAEEEIRQENSKSKEITHEKSVKEKNKKLIKKAENEISKKNYEKALNLINEYLNEDSNNIKVLMMKADAFRSLRRFNEALSIYDTVKNIDKNFADAYLYSGEIHDEIFKDPAKTKKNYQVFIKLKPGSKKAKELKKKIKNVEDGKKKEKKQKKIPAKKKEPLPPKKTKKERAYIHYNEAVKYQRSGQLGKAIDAYKKSISLNPSNSKAYYNLGIIWKQKKQYQEAINNYKNAVKIKPDYSSAYYNLGVIYNLLKDYEQAIYCFRKAITIKQSYADAYFALGLIYSNHEKNIEKARFYYKKYLNLRPNSPNAIKIRSWLEATGNK